METVKCLSSSSYAERPLAFSWLGVYLQVQAVLQRWRSPQGVGFRVQADNENIYNLIYDENLDRWSIDPAG